MMYAMGITALFDILLFSVFVYGLIMLLKQTRALFVVYGIIIVSFVYGAAEVFNFPLTAQALNLFFSVFLIGIIILFQAELRRYFEIIAIALSPTAKNIGKKPAVEDIDCVVRVAERFAKERIGMLIVFTGRESLGRH
jgi:diadenylate cyclase